MRYITSAYAIVCALLIGCLHGESDNATSPTGPSYSINELQVIENTYIVRDAAEAFAGENNGVYPSRTTDETDSGKSFRSFLPDGQSLVNPYTGLPTEPTVGVAGSPGETAYYPDSDTTNVVRGYWISGYGDDDLIIEIRKLAR